jgi:predicted DCC family thiol-disulfide oxidoreductase YuxK
MDEALQTRERKGVWFVYDGDCPMCSMAAHALKIQQRHGPLHIVDARRDTDAPLLLEINRRKLNLDEGMVILCDGRFYHGQDALRFMARFGSDDGWFNRINRGLFRSDALTRFSYPVLRATRNLLLKIKGVPQLNNLRNNDEPLFKSVFGFDWERLPVVMHRHYANRPYQDDVVTVTGTLNVYSSLLGRLLKPAFRWANALVPYEGTDIPVTVDFHTDTQSNAFRFERTFYFPGRSPYVFRSTMIPVGGNELVEMMGRGIGWRAAYSWDGEKVILRHKGYVIRLFGRFIPLPFTFLMGAGYAEEIALSDDSFSMWTEIRHPFWGRVFGYDGAFKVTKDR